MRNCCWRRSWSWRRAIGPRARNTPRCSLELHDIRRRAANSSGCSQEEPDNRLFKTLYATAGVGLGEHERAVELVSRAAAGDAADADLHLSIAHALKTLGRRRRRSSPTAGRRPAGRTSAMPTGVSPTSRPTASPTRSWHGCAPRNRPSCDGAVDRYHLCFALGKALEDRGDYAESFRYYELGNALKRAESKYRPEIIENNTRQQIEVCTAEFFAGRRGCGCARTGSHFHRRPAALGLDAARTDPGLALPGRGHAGTRQHPADRRQSARPRSGSEQSALPAHARADGAGGIRPARRAISRRHADLPHGQALSSSTRCRTTSGTWG